MSSSNLVSAPEELNQHLLSVCVFGGQLKDSSSRTFLAGTLVWCSGLHPFSLQLHFVPVRRGSHPLVSFSQLLAVDSAPVVISRSQLQRLPVAGSLVTLPCLCLHVLGLWLVGLPGGVAPSTVLRPCSPERMQLVSWRIGLVSVSVSFVACSAFPLAIDAV